MTTTTKPIPTTTSKLPKKVQNKIEQACLKSYKELQIRKERSKKLTTALESLSLQRNLMKKGSKRKLPIIRKDEVDGDEEDGQNSDLPKAIFKWKRERAR